MCVMPLTLVQGWLSTWWTLKPNHVHTKDKPLLKHEPLLKDGLQVTLFLKSDLYKLRKIFDI